MGVFLLALVTWLPADPQALLRFEPPRIDLGPVKAGQMFERQVRVANVGQTPVRVREIKSSCGCLVPKLEPEVLQPGQSAELRLRVNSLSAHPGPQAWRVTLFAETASGVQPQEILLLAEVEQELVISPASVSIYGNRRATEHTLLLTDRRPRKLRLLKVDATSPLILVTLPAQGVDSTGATEVKVTVQPGFSIGRHDEQIILYTDDPEYPQLRVPVTVIRKPAQSKPLRSHP